MTTSWSVFVRVHLVVIRDDHILDDVQCRKLCYLVGGWRCHLCFSVAQLRHTESAKTSSLEKHILELESNLSVVTAELDSVKQQLNIHRT